MRVRVRSITACALFFSSALLTFGQVAPRPLVTQALDETQLATLEGNTHPLARPEFDIGVAPPDQPLRRMLLVLKRSPEQQFALTKLLDDQQDKASSNYHKWLTPDEFGAKFGPADQDIQAVTGWLQSHGLQVNRVTHGKTIIEFSGAESQLEEALHTQIHKYLVNGEEHWANASDPQIPAALAPAVAGVWTLHDFRKNPNVRMSPEKLIKKYTRGEAPNTTFNNGTLHALSPADYATIYNINPLYNNAISGQGITIAVVARSNLFNQGQDVFNFQQIFDPLCCGGVQIVLDGEDPGDLGGNEEVEATLDATWTSAIAPAATVKFVVSASTLTTDGVDLSELYIIDNNLAPVMTESFGSCEAGATQGEVQGIQQLAEQGAAQGISYMVSSGDSGAAGCDNPNLVPATHGQSVSVLGTPFNTVVGGTEFNEDNNPSKYWSSTNAQNLGSALSYIPEDVWNESCSSCQNPGLLSTGGGVSTVYKPKPTWQSGVTGIPNDAARDQPDVALTSAGHDPYLVCLEGSCVPDAQGFVSFAAVFGTSASSPSFAGIMALVNQEHGAQGQANYVLYQLAATENSTFSQCNASKASALPPSTCVFNDVTVGNNSVPGQAGFSAGVGYDLATGLGSVDVSTLAQQWGNVTFRATTTALNPTTITAVHGAAVNLGVSVTPNSGSGTPTGDVSLLTGNNQGVGFLTLSNGAASAAFDDLPGGTYTLTAQYAGDGTFAPSPASSPINVTISPENSSTVLSVLTADALGNPVPFSGGPYGSFIFLDADVTANSGHGEPTGQLNIVDNGSPFTTLSLNAAGNAETPQGIFTFNAGNHSVQARYPGDSSFNASSSTAVSFNISQASTSTSLSATPTAAASGTNVSLTAAVVSPGFGQSPTGQVNFSMGTTLLGSAFLQANGIAPNGAGSTAFFSTTTLPAGQDGITATYVGDSNYLGSTSPAVIVALSTDFAFAAANSSVTITSPGGSATNMLSITGQPGYNATITFQPSSCSGLPPFATCSFNPQSVTGSGSTTVTITTKAPSAALQTSPTAMGLIFFGALLLSIPIRRFRTIALCVLLLTTVSFTSVGCGGGSSGGGSGGGGSPGTPTGSYSVTVVASDGTSSHPSTFTLVVQ
jgi:Pro-kumamolisin, activation domain/Bacterial Ig-like domain (group 3)